MSTFDEDGDMPTGKGDDFATPKEELSWEIEVGDMYGGKDGTYATPKEELSLEIEGGDMYGGTDGTYATPKEELGWEVEGGDLFTGIKGEDDFANSKIIHGYKIDGQDTQDDQAKEGWFEDFTMSGGDGPVPDQGIAGWHEDFVMPDQDVLDQAKGDLSDAVTDDWDIERGDDIPL